MAGLLSRYFGFEERQTDLATEVRAGLTTIMVMAYIIFVNPIILGFTGVPGLDGKGLPFAATLTVTCLAAGVLSIGMGFASNYPFALAAGMGLNAVVAFDLVAGRGLSWPQAMTVVFLEGAIITVLVLTRFREAVMDAVPLGLKRAISVGIGLFIAFIGFFTSGLVVQPAAGPGPARGLPAGSVRRRREQRHHHHLPRVRGWRDRGRADRARVRGGRPPVPGGDVLLAAGQRHSGSGDGPGADHRRMLHDGHRARYSLGRL